MRLARVVGRRLSSLLRRSRAEAELHRELQLHLDQLTREYRATGLSDADARLAAQREFGAFETFKEECRDMRRVNLVEDLMKDVRYAIRLLGRSPGFTLTAVLSLALGIGANTAIFSLVNAFLLRPLPYDAPDRLVVLFERNVMGNEPRMAVSPGNFLDWQKAATSFAHVTAQTGRTVTVARDAAGSGTDAERVGVCICSGNLLSTLGVSPIVGRAFGPNDDRFGAPRAVMISFDLWQRQFNGSPDVVGQMIRIDSEPSAVIGVMPRGFMYPARDVEVWQPLLTSLPATQQIRHDLHFLRVIARLRDDVTIEQARAELDGIAASYKAAHPQEATGSGAAVVPLHDELAGDVRQPLIVLFAAVSCVLLIACLNIANLMLTRAMTRAREVGVRTALGATRGRIIRQLVTESVVLGLAGGALGALLAWWLANALVARAPGANALLASDRVPFDPMVFGFTLIVALVTGVAVGLFPAIRGSRTDVTTDLKERTSTVSRGHGRIRDGLIAVEVGLSLVLLTVAGLLVHSFVRLQDVQPGVRTDHVLTMGTTLPGAGYREQATRSAALAQIGERLQTVPGVRSAGLTTCAPLTGICNVLFFYVEGRPYTPGKFLAALDRTVDPGYFAAAGIPLVRGRGFTREDGVGFDAKNPKPGRIVISERMARQFFPGEEAIGKRIFFDYEVQREKVEGLPAPRYEIVGVVGDTRHALHEDIAPTMYRPLLDIAPRGFSIVLHTSIEPRSVVNSVRDEMRRFDPNVAVFRIRTMEDLLGQSTADRRFNMMLVTAFAALAMLLAAVGLYGVVSYAVSQRTIEIGLRMALGASTADVRRLMLMQGLKPTIAGMILGLVAAVFATQVVRSLLFQITPTDPVTFALVPPLLLVLATLACYVPARRATRLDPTVALRAE